MLPISSDFFSLLKYPHKLKAVGDNRIAFLLKTTSPQKKQYSSDLYVGVDGTIKRLTTDLSVGNFWVNAQNEIIFSARKIDNIGPNLIQTTLYKVSKKMGFSVNKPLLQLTQEIRDIVFLPDGRFLFTAVFNPETDRILHLPITDHEKGQMLTEASAVAEITELPFWRNGAGFCSKTRTRLYLYDGRKIIPLTDEETNIEELRSNHNNSGAYYLANTPKNDVSALQNQLWFVDFASLTHTNCSLGESFMHDNFVPLPQGKTLVFGDTSARHGMSNNGCFHLISTETRQQQLLEDSGMYSGENLVANDTIFASSSEWQLYGDDVYFISTQNAQNQLFFININSGKILPAINFEGDISEFAILPNGLIFCLAQTKNSPTELYFFDKNSPDGTDIFAPLTTFNTTTMAQSTISLPEPISFTNSDGFVIDGWVIKPTEYQKGKLYPAILSIHGGPRLAYTPSLSHEMQYLAAQGFAVFFCNPRGSGDKGNDFADIFGKCGKIDYDDLMQFTDEVLASCPWIDKNRLGVSGGSYGGFMANWIIGQTNRFKAAITQRSIANWITMATTTDIGYFFVPSLLAVQDITMHTELWDASPLKYAKNIQTPLLILHSSEDYRCYQVEAMQMFTTLKVLGVETKMCIFKNENHTLSRYGKAKNRIRRLEEIAGWFKKHLSQP